MQDEKHYNTEREAVEAQEAFQRIFGTVLSSEGAPDEKPGLTRAQQRWLARREAKAQKRGQRAFDRQQRQRQQNVVTARNMSRAMAGDFGEAMQRNVQAVADAEEKRAIVGKGVRRG